MFLVFLIPPFFVFSIIIACQGACCNDAIQSGDEKCCALTYLIIVGVIFGIIVLSLIIYGMDSLGNEFWNIGKHYVDTHHLRMVIDKE